MENDHCIMFGTGDISEDVFKDGFNMDGVTVDGFCDPKDPRRFAVRIRHPRDNEMVIHCTDCCTLFIEPGTIIAKVDAAPKNWGSIIIGVKGKYDNLAWV